MPLSYVMPILTKTVCVLYVCRFLPLCYQGFVRQYGDPLVYQRERVNEGAPATEDQPRLFAGVHPRRKSVIHSLWGGSTVLLLLMAVAVVPYCINVCMG